MANPYEGWAIVELMGHRKLAGQLTEQEIAGSAFLRLDVHGGEQAVTQFYAPGAVYCITPTTEEIARALGAKSMPAPVSRYELEPLRRCICGPAYTGDPADPDVSLDERPDCPVHAQDYEDPF